MFSSSFYDIFFVSNVIQTSYFFFLGKVADVYEQSNWRVSSVLIETPEYQCFVKQSGHENYGHDHICLIFYQLLPTTSVGNE